MSAHDKRDPVRIDGPAMVAATREDDTPLPRRPRPIPGDGKTIAVDAVTHPHRSGDTEKLAELDTPVAGPREPTQMLDPPTRPLAMAEIPVPGPDPFDRLAMAVEDLMRVAEALEVERKPMMAQLVNGLAAAMRGSASPRPLEYVACRLGTRALLADGGVGVRLDEQEITRTLVDVGAVITGGLDAQRRAARALAQQLTEDAKRYRGIAEKHRERGRVADDTATREAALMSAAGWEHRADELGAQATRIMRENR